MVPGPQDLWFASLLGIIMSDQGNICLIHSEGSSGTVNYELVPAIMNVLKHEVRGVFLLRVLPLCGQVFISKASILYHFTACILLYILFLFPSVIPLASDNNPFASSFFWGENWSQRVSTLSTPLTVHHRSWGGDPRLRCWGGFVFLPHSQCRLCQSKLREPVLMKGGIEVGTRTANKRWRLTTALTRS